MPTDSFRMARIHPGHNGLPSSDKVIPELMWNRVNTTKLSYKHRSENILVKANLKCLNEAVASITATTAWKSKQSMNPLGQCLFRERLSLRSTRSTATDEILQPVPGYPMLASNHMARLWNCIPELWKAATLCEARAISRKWAKTIPTWPHNNYTFTWP